MMRVVSRHLAVQRLIRGLSGRSALALREGGLVHEPPPGSEHASWAQGMMRNALES